VFDLAVDLRRSSPTYLKWVGVELSAENRRQLFVPRGFAHGFLTLSQTAEFCYKCDDIYQPQNEITVVWNDPRIGIEWPLKDAIISAKDQAGWTTTELEASGRCPI
jgi:dTDP-4-dehydrorhamnose 3,5-epimerase